MRWLFCVCLMAASCAYADDSREGLTYDSALQGKECKDDSMQQLTCEYRLGSGLHISIIALGSPYAAVYFRRADFEADYYVVLGLLHGCLIIKRKANISDLAFISPKNGKIYRGWRECGEAY